MKRVQTRVPSSIQKERLDFFLAEWLPHAIGKPVSKSQIRTLIASGAVYVNRHRNRTATTPLFSGAVVEVYYDEDKMNQMTGSQMTKMYDIRLDASLIVYEDDAIIVIDKPSGLPTQPTLDPNRANLFGLVKKLIKERDKVVDPYVGLHHRLDKDTSGLVLFTKKESANKSVSELFSKHQIQKTYQCICWRSPDARKLEPKETFTIENNLGKIGERGGKAQYGEVSSGGDHAITHFTTIEIFRDMYWLQAMPQTGRTHQIRVHCAEMFMPIIGDELYFPEKLATIVSSPRLMLHASELRFKHPVTNKQMVINSNLPSEFVHVLGQLKS